MVGLIVIRTRSVELTYGAVRGDAVVVGERRAGAAAMAVVSVLQQGGGRGGFNPGGVHLQWVGTQRAPAHREHTVSCRLVTKKWYYQSQKNGTLVSWHVRDHSMFSIGSL